MNIKEVAEVRRHIRRDRSNMTAIYGCYVNESKEIIAEFRSSTGMMSENEADKYFAILRRTLGGTLGKNLLDITFRTDNLSERKDVMVRESDVLVALPGGVGTLDEIFHVVAAAMIGYHTKKVILYNGASRI